MSKLASGGRNPPRQVGRAMDLDISGDRPLPTSGRHGIDVASQRVDQLDAAGLRIDAVIGRRNQILVPVASVLSGT